jgi:ABC-2 type transport system permease protein
MTEHWGRGRDLVEIELERAARTRTTWTIAGAMVFVAALVVYGAVHPAAASTGAGGPPTAGQQIRAAVSGVGTLRVFVTLLGVLFVTSQYHHGDIVWRYLADPSRALFVASKAVACAVIGAFLGLVVLQLAAVMTVAHAGSLGLSGGEAASTVAGTVAGMALAGILGVGVGAAVRSQTAAVVGTLVAVLLVEPLVTAVAPAVGRYLPSAAAGAAAGGGAALGWVAGLALYAGYAGVAAVTGVVLCRRSDV